MMKPICEVDEENHHGGPDPPVPLLVHVPSHGGSPEHVSSLKHPLAVLETTEILENVFAHVDVVTLLTSVQRVSKTWKQVVDGSVLLQRKLFFVPDETHPLEPHPHTRLQKDSDSGKVYPVLNSLLVRHFRSSFFSLGTKFYGFTRRSESFYEQRWTSKHSTLKRKNAGHIKYKSVKPDVTQVEALQVSLDRDRFTRAGASWRRMLVSQPPIPDFLAMEFGPTRIHDPDSPEKLRFDTLTAHDADKGLCMGQLYDFVQDRVSHHPLDCLWYRVVWFEPRAPFASDLNEDSCVMAFDDLGTKCVVEMFHREDKAKRLPLSSLSTFPPGFAVREAGPLSPSRQIVSTSKRLHNPLDPGHFDAIFKCDEFEPADWSPAHEATDYYLVARRTLFQLED